MIPKIIHYCWLSDDPYPPLIEKCIESWHKNLPDYEFVLWNPDRFDIDSVKWVRQAFDAKFYPFAADYIRIYALYNYGGIYLDSDVEVLKSFDPLLNLPYFICRENDIPFENAVMGSVKSHPYHKLLLNHYETSSFIMPNGRYNTTPMPWVVKKVFDQNGINIKNIRHISQFKDKKNIINVFSASYFSRPSPFKILPGFNNNYSIHHFNGSWLNEEVRRLVHWRLKLLFIPRFLRFKFSRWITYLESYGFFKTFDLWLHALLKHRHKL